MVGAWLFNGGSPEEQLGGARSWKVGLFLIYEMEIVIPPARSCCEDRRENLESPWGLEGTQWVLLGKRGFFCFCY